MADLEKISKQERQTVETIKKELDDLALKEFPDEVNVFFFLRICLTKIALDNYSVFASQQLERGKIRLYLSFMSNLFQEQCKSAVVRYIQMEKRNEN